MDKVSTNSKQFSPVEAADISEIHAISHRVLNAIKLLNPTDYRKVQRTSHFTGNNMVRAQATLGDFILGCYNGGWVTVVVNSRSWPTTVFTLHSGQKPLVCNWIPYVCREILLPALNQVLILEDLASI